MASLRLDENGEVVSGVASSVDHPRHRCDPPPFPVVQYIEQYSGRLKGRRISAMRLAGDLHKISDARTGRLRDIAVVNWIKLSGHWGEVGPVIRFATIWKHTVRTSFV